ncbi:hypothetical protein [uncultured Sphingomonas sp.]|uniref:hypothetical protein n=1 Tax=uncultured Sphingomonas sp. TaxID=158754 RepID=UPI0035CBE70F
MTLHAPIAVPRQPLALSRPVTIAALALAAWALATGLLWNVALNNDVSWQFWVARQLRHGARFGRGVIEVNPPLWFWEAMPLSALADRLGLATARVLVAATTARTVLGVLLTIPLVARTPVQRLAAASGLFVLLLALPVFCFGEREHLLLLGALPYAALAAHRAEWMPVDRRLALVIGLTAGWSFALKPYFALIPLALEIWLWGRQRRRWRPLRPETGALAVIALAYGGAVLAFAPDWLARVVPMARLFYADFAPPAAWPVTRQPYLPAWLLGALALLAARPRSARTQAAAVATAAFLACYLLQAKGFPYHALPVTVGLAWALWLLILDGGADAAALARRPLAVLAILLAFATAALIGSFRAPPLGGLAPVVDRLPPGTRFAVISAHSWDAFPMVEQRGFVQPLSTANPMMALKTVLREGEGPHATSDGLKLRRWMLDTLAGDLARCPAEALLIDDAAASPVLAGTGVSYLAWLGRDPRFAALLAAYRPAARDGGRLLLLARPGRLPRPSACPIAPAVAQPD